MPIAQVQDDSTGRAKDSVSDKLDLLKYRSDGLVGNILELLSVPRAFWNVLQATFLLTLVVLFAVVTIFSGAALPGVAWIAATRCWQDVH
jgi:hypothetical protein